jgi:predicted transcriptional regulator
MVNIEKEIAIALRSSQLTATQLAEQIGENYKTVYGYLTKMRESNLVEKLDDKTYVLTDLGIVQYPVEPQKIDALLPKITPKIQEKTNLTRITRKINDANDDMEKSAHDFCEELKPAIQSFNELFETRAIKPINEKTVNEIKRTVNYDATTPSHYQGKTIQVFDVLNEFLTPEANQGFYVGNIIKYVVRFKGKNGKEDLLKASEYLNKLIDSL